MLFTEPSFLFFFLPLVLLVHVLLPQPGGRAWLRNLWLLAASLVFFLWREKLGLLLVPLLLNGGLGAWVGRTRGKPSGAWAITAAVALNLALLVWFKYANFLADNVSVLSELGGGPAIQLKEVALPLGISFLTFHGISHAMDIHRGDAPAAGGFLGTALYLAFFPKLIAGPIVRYQDFASQLKSRAVTREDLAFGAQRIIVGLAKKTLLAEALALQVDPIFRLSPHQLGAGLAWLGALGYTLQLYLDFSGYSDIAIGLARMFGFRFPENFHYPYLSRSITEFWRRWHISLSTWFRDYLFFPLGANRRGPARGYLNLLIVFFLCGLWHGAGWTFAVWGLWHGAFLVLERIALGRRLTRLWAPLQHGYALLVIITGWVIFRSGSLEGGLLFLKAMAGLAAGPGEPYRVAMFLDRRLAVALVAGILACTPVVPRLRAWMTALPERLPRYGEPLRRSLVAGGIVALVTLLLVSSLAIAANAYHPFLYARF